MPVNEFPSDLLTHSVTVSRRSTAITNGQPVESLTPLGTAACLISSVSSSRGVNDQEEVVAWSATLTGVSSLLGEAGVVFVVVSGPMPVGTVLFPAGGMSPHGPAAGISQFFRFQTSSVAVG